MVVRLGSRKLTSVGYTSEADDQIPSCQLRGPELEYLNSRFLDSRQSR
jgi:hypothetical protein